MAKYTENIRLAQPEGSDYYDIEVFNHNSELIDKKIGEMDNSLSIIKEGATRAKAGIVQLGTEEGKALEGMMLARIFGCVGYGGDIQGPGVKDVNYLYYDRNTRKMYKCLNQNSDVSANVANFVPLDNNSLLEKLENLIKTDTYGAQNGGYFQLFNRIIIYGSFNYIFGSSSIQNFEIRESIKNWENANVICSWREINLNLTNTTVSALMTSPTTLSIKSNVASSGRGTVSYLIIARV